MVQSLTLIRYCTDKHGTWGVLVCGSAWVCHTLEPINTDGGYHHAVSVGTYSVSMYPSKKFGRKLPLLRVPGRDGILIHAGNHCYDSVGCVLVGRGRCESMLLQSRAAVEDVVAVIKQHDVQRITITDYETISKRP